MLEPLQCAWIAAKEPLERLLIEERYLALIQLKHYEHIVTVGHPFIISMQHPLTSKEELRHVNYDYG